MTELIEIMFWFGSERNVRWSDDSRREYDGHNEQAGQHETTATKYHRHHLRKLQIPANETLQK